MEPQAQQPQILNSYNTQPEPKKHGHLGFWLIIIILLAALGGTYTIYSMQQKKIDDLNGQVNSLNSKNKDLDNKLATANAQIKLVSLPAKSDFSPQCESKDNSELLIAPVTTEPVKGYQFYVISCFGQPNIPPRITALKVKDDGTREFAYGAGTGEPMCISKAAFADAEEISKLTKISICKT